MADSDYIPATWVDGVTPITAAQLTRLETGVELANDRLDTAEAGLAGLGTATYRNTAALLRHKLATSQRAVWTHFGDSTSNEPTDWLRVALATFAADYPNVKVEHRLWNDTGQVYDAATTVQAGDGGTAPTPTFSDTFTRSALINASTADTGQAWAATGGSTNGTHYVFGNTATATHAIDPANADGIVGNARFVLPAGLTGAVRLYILSDLGTNELFVDVTASAPSCTITLYQRVAGSATSLGTASITVSSSGERTVDVSLRIKSGVATGSMTIGGTTNGATGTLSVPGGWAGYVSGSRRVSVTGAATALLDYITVGVNPPDPSSLIVYNGSMPGGSAAYQQARIALMAPEAPDFLTVGHGHNHGSESPAVFLAAIQTLVSSVLALYPSAGVALSSQNAQFSPWGTPTSRAAHLARILAIGPYAADRGWGYIPAAEAFLQRADRGLALLIADGVHPSTTGSALWAAVAVEFLRAKATLAAVARSGSASDITTGTLSDAVIPAAIARDAEVAAAYLAKPTAPAVTSSVVVTSGGTVETRPLREVREYMASASPVTTPTGITGGLVTVYAAGGGGGAGRRGAASTARSGGGGGAPGGVLLDWWIPASLWASTYAVTVAAGGSGAPAVTTDDTSGAAGSVGGLSVIVTDGRTYRPSGGVQGSGGTAVAAPGGSAPFGFPAGTVGAPSSVATAPAAATASNGTPTGGGGGGGISTADVAFAGGAAGTSTGAYAPGGTAGAVDGASPTAGSAGPAPFGGRGGGGGAASITTAAQAGAVGGFPGAGGGGGGGALNGNNSGAGGNGGDGYVRITFLYH